MRNATLEYQPTRTLTVAELCEAIASGALQAQIKDDMYIVHNRDLMRLTRPQTLSLPFVLPPRKGMRRAS